MENRGAFVITGAGRGLGAAIAKSAYSAEFPLALLARTEKDLKEVKQNLESSLGGMQKISTHVVDLTDSKKTAVVFKEIKKTHGDIRALINNAGTWMGTHKIETLKREEIQRSLDLNFFSAFNATQEVLAVRNHLKRSELSIINIGATASLQGWGGVTAFCLGKAALRIFSQALARELGPKGVHVAHLVIDGALDNERTRRLSARASGTKFIDLDSVSADIMRVAMQERSCWTFEWDIRPASEEW